MTDLFLIILALLWLVIASIQDLKKREIANWLSFSLIIFSLAYVLFYALITKNLAYFLYKLLGLGIFIGLGFGLYYSRVFAGGDAKLIMPLGIVLSISTSFYPNIINYASFLFLLLISGGLYGFFYSFFILIRNRGKVLVEMKKNFLVRKKEIFLFIILALISLAIPVYLKDNVLFFLPLIIFIFPFLLIYAKALENCMISQVSWKNLTVGDWLYQKVKVRGKTINPYWEGLSEKELALLKKHKKNVLIKQGIPFVPSFLIAFILLLILNTKIPSITGIN